MPSLQHLGRLVLKNFGNGALQPVAELLQRIEGDVLFSQFEPVKRGVRNAGFAGELLKSQVPAPFSEERGQLLCQSSLCHDWMLQPVKSHMWDILIDQVLCEAYKRRREIECL